MHFSCLETIKTRTTESGRGNFSRTDLVSVKLPGQNRLNHYLLTAVGGIALLTGTTDPAALTTKGTTGCEYSNSAHVIDVNNSCSRTSPEPISLPPGGGTGGEISNSLDGSVTVRFLAWVTYQVTPGIVDGAAPGSALDGFRSGPSVVQSRDADGAQAESTTNSLMTLGVRG